MRIKKEKKSEAEIVADTLKGLERVIDAATPVPAPTDGEQHFQFTKRAHYRVMNSYHIKRLWEMFQGEHDVDLPVVEWTILSFEKERGPAEKELEADVPTVGTLAVCDFQLSVPCLNLGYEFLPRKWISKQGKGKLTGNYTGSIEGQLTVACEPCKSEYADYAKAKGEKIPYFTSREEVEAYLERRHAHGELTQSLRGQMEKIRAGMQKKPAGDRR